jgi:hypothetical protein
MQQRLSPGEYWILTSAVRIKYAIAWLVEPDIEITYNRRSHGMTVEETANTLTGLFERGLLEVERRSPAADGCVRGRLSCDEVLPALRGKPGRMHYVLTNEGGAAWEAFAQPAWDWYIGHERDEDRWIVTCTDRNLLARYLYATAWLERTPEIRAAVVEEIGAWAATYWKTLPRGFRVSYPAVDEEPPVFTRTDEWLQWNTMFQGTCAMRQGWCPIVR